MSKQILILPGDGIGPEIMAEAVKVLNALDEKFELEHAPVGGAGYEASGHPLPDATLKLAKDADAILASSRNLFAAQSSAAALAILAFGLAALALFVLAVVARRRADGGAGVRGLWRGLYRRGAGVALDGGWHPAHGLGCGGCAGGAGGHGDHHVSARTLRPAGRVRLSMRVPGLCAEVEDAASACRQERCAQDDGRTARCRPAPRRAHCLLLTY
mgnify:CR=1 FL=1